MLINCPECKLQISDKAVFCPHCGYTFKEVKPRAVKKRKRLPNGFGQISEIKGQNLRNPFRVMITTCVNEYGRPIQKLLKPKAYFRTYNEAYEALMDHHRNPYDIRSEITMSELFDKWMDWHSKYIAEITALSIRNSWKYASSIYNLNIKDVHTYQLKECLENASIEKDGRLIAATPAIKNVLKSSLNMLYDYAISNEFIDKNYARMFELDPSVGRELNENRKTHTNFTDDEISMLWNDLSTPNTISDLLLYQCYSGWRPQELGNIMLEDVNLLDGYILGGMKTKSGKNRLVPIHPKVRNIIEKRWQEAKDLGSPYLFNCFIAGKTKFGMEYPRYNYQFKILVERLGLNPEHRAHDPRVHFVSLCKKYNVDDMCIKRMIGHAISDLTENTYTVRELQWFKTEIAKIK